MNTATKTLSALSALALFAGSAHAASIYSEDFEGAVFNQGGNTFNTSAGWASTDFTATGNLNELSASSFASHLSGLGNAFGILSRGVTSTADLGINFLDDTTYTFSFEHFRRTNTLGDDLTAEIQTASGTVLATETFAPVTGVAATDIESRVVSYTTNGGAEVGQEIRLVFIDPSPATNSTNQAGIDNIVLDAVPEPGSLALLGLCGLLIARNRRG